MKLFLHILAASVLLSSLMHASGTTQDSAGTRSFSTLTVQSSPESARVSIDGLSLGFTPLTIDSLSSGMHLLTLQHPDAESWLTEPVADSIHFTEAEHKMLRFDLRTRYIISSSPFGAEVVLRDSVIGTTPLIAPSEFAQQSLLLRKPGYEPASIQLSKVNVISVPMKKIWQSDANGDPHFREYDGTRKKPIGLYISGVATVVSGVAAAYLKTRADDRYQGYLRTGERHLLSDTRHLDTAAGIAIIATQVSLGLFTYFILSQ